MSVRTVIVRGHARRATSLAGVQIVQSAALHPATLFKTWCRLGTGLHLTIGTIISDSMRSRKHYNVSSIA